jgi:ABC-type spermidine/putrescine transport system permease subunit I
MKIEQNITAYSDWGAASALAVVLIVVVGLILLVSRWLTSRGAAWR